MTRAALASCPGGGGVILDLCYLYNAIVYGYTIA